MSKKNWIKYLIPGFIFQSVVIGGGYGTGAEIKEFFLTQGFVGGLLGMIVTTIIWSLVCAASFEFARVFKAFDYNSLMDGLLGKAKYLYEICYIVLLLIVLGVINATAASMFNSLTGLSGMIGIAILTVGISALVILGTDAIEKALTVWSYLLYAVYLLFMIICLTKFGGAIGAEFAKGEISGSWLKMGANYAYVNLGIVPALLYTVRDCETRKEAVVSGLLAGVIGVIPALLLLICIAGATPATLEASTPVAVLFDLLQMKWLYVLFEIVLFGTLIETGTGFIKAVDDRIEIYLEKKGKLTSAVRPAVAIALVAIGIAVAQFGLTGLIAKGYGTICYGFLFFFVLPILTIGVYKIIKASK